MRDGWVQTKLTDAVEILDRFRKPINSTERAARQGAVPYYGANGQAGWINDFIFDEELVLLGEDAIDFSDPRARKSYLIVGPSWVNNHAHVLRAKPGIVNSHFLSESLNIVDYSQYVSFGTRSKLTQGSMKGIKLQLPPLPVQDRIVDLISGVDSYIEVVEQQLVSSKQARNAVLNKLMVEALEEGNQVRLSEITRLITDGSHHSPKTVERGLPYVTVRDVKNGSLDIANAAKISEQSFFELEKNGCRPLKDDILFSKDGTVGKVALVKTNERFVVLSSLAILRTDENKVLPRYLALAMSSEDFQRAAIGSKTGLAIKRIVLKHLKCLTIPVPSIETQNNIVAEIEVFDAHLESLTNVLDSIELLRVGLLSQLLRGQFLIPESYDKIMDAR